MGRPTKLTPQVEKIIAGSLVISHNITLACEHAHIHPATYRAWLERGEAELETWQAESTNGERAARDVNPDDVRDQYPFLAFLAATRKAMTDFELEALAYIREAGTGYESVVTKRVTRSKDGKTDVTEETTTRTLRDWHALAWTLERIKNDKYARNRLEVTGEGGGPVVITTEEMRAAAVKQLTEHADRLGIPAGEQPALEPGDDTE